MESNTSDPEYRNLFRANNQLKQTPRVDDGLDYQGGPGKRNNCFD